MDDIYYEKILYRILQGRHRVRVGDLVLYIYEPDIELLEDSLDVYDDAYKEAYYNGVPIQSEVKETLVENNIWNPFDEKEIETLEKQIEDTKLEVFEKFYDKRTRNSLKMRITKLEERLLNLFVKRESLNHTSCEGAAKFARSLWLLAKTTFYSNGDPYDWKHFTTHSLYTSVQENEIKHEDIRYIARNSPWRAMWTVGKKSGNLFPDSKVSTYTSSQQMLAHYSIMYDNIYEHPESPTEKIIEDDHALDGWMIKQRREREKQKKQQEVNALTKNPKIANAQEVFVMARDQEAANEIYNLNNPLARKTINDRNRQISEADGELDFRQLADVKQDIQIQSHLQARDAAKGRGRGRGRR